MRTGWNLWVNGLVCTQDVILECDAFISQSKVFSRIVPSVGALLTENKLVTLHACVGAILNKTRLLVLWLVCAVEESRTRSRIELTAWYPMVFPILSFCCSLCP